MRNLHPGVGSPACGNPIMPLRATARNGQTEDSPDVCGLRGAARVRSGNGCPVPMRQPDYRHAVFSVMKRMLLTSGKTSENTQGPSTCRRYRRLHQFLQSFPRLHQRRQPKLRPKQMWPFSGERFPLQALPPPKTFCMGRRRDGWRVRPFRMRTSPGYMDKKYKKMKTEKTRKYPLVFFA